MRYWSRILALLLAVLLCIPLFSCTGDKPTTQPEKTTEGVLNWAGRGKAEQKSTPEPEMYPLTFGLGTGDSSLPRTYMNPYFNLRFDLDHDWFVYATREIDSQNGFREATMESRKEKYMDYLSSGKAVSDFFAQSNSGLMSIGVHVAYWMEDRQPGEDITAYCERFVQVLRSSFPKNDIQLIDDVLSKATVAGESWPCWYFSYDIEGCTTYYADVFMQNGDYMLILDFGCMGKDYNRELFELVEKIH